MTDLNCRAKHLIEDTLWDMLGEDDDQLGLDHVDKIRNARTGMGDLFLK